MSNRRSIADFPRNEVGLVDEFIGTAYDTVKKVYDNLPEIQRLDGVLEEIDHVADDTIQQVIDEKIPPIVEGMAESVAQAQKWAEGTQPDPEIPTSKSARQWASEAQNQSELGKQQIDTAVATGKSEISQAMTGMENILTLVEEAKDAALLSGSVFETVAAGLAATAEGKYFSVPSPDDSEYLILYQKVSGAAIKVDTYPSATAVKKINDLIEAVPEAATIFSDAQRFILMKLLSNGTLDMLATQLINMKDGIKITDANNFVTSYIGSKESNLHGMILRHIPQDGIFFSDENGFIVGKMAPDGSFFGQNEGSMEPVVPVTQTYAPKLHQQWRTMYKLILMYGQSLSVGHSARPAISTTQPYGNLMLKSGPRSRRTDNWYDASELVPLIEIDDGGNMGETPVTAVCNSITRRAIEDSGEPVERWTMIGAAPGNSGWSVEQLSPAPITNLRAFERAVEVIEDIEKLVSIRGDGDLSVWAYCWVQGETNYTSTWYSTSYDYGQHQMNIFDSMTNKVMDITGQDFRPYTCTYQCGAHRRYNSDKMNVAKAQWRISRERPDVIIGSPGYIFMTAADNLHLSNEGSWLMGEYFGRALHHTMINRGQKWRPLEPVEVSWADTYIDIKFHVPRGPLVIDNALAATTPNAGFYVRENDVVVDKIGTVTVTGPDTVRVTLTAPAEANAVLTYARGKPGDTAHSGPLTGARGNLRDSHGDYDKVTSPAGVSYNMHNACVMFEYSRKNGF